MIHFAGFLKTPLNDVEYMVKFYELGGGGAAAARARSSSSPTSAVRRR